MPSTHSCPARTPARQEEKCRRAGQAARASSPINAAGSIRPSVLRGSRSPTTVSSAERLATRTPRRVRAAVSSLHAARRKSECAPYIFADFLRRSPATAQGSPNRPMSSRRPRARQEQENGGRGAASKLLRSCRTETPVPAPQSASENSCRLCQSRRRARNRARGEERTSGPQSGGRRHRAVAHRP